MPSHDSARRIVRPSPARRASRRGFGSRDPIVCVIESLERRVMLSATLVDGMLVIDGTESDDVIQIVAGKAAGQVIVQSAPGVERRTAFDGVTGITVNALGGDDRIDIGPRLRAADGSLIGVTIDAGSGNDKVRGGQGDDTILGGEGDDRINAGKGDDAVDAGAGRDSVHGGQDDDTLRGGDGDDTIHGQSGHDTIEGDGGRDSLFGGDGDDQLNGGLGRDKVASGSGADVIDVSDGLDKVNDADDNDTLLDGSENDDGGGTGVTDDHGDTIETATSLLLTTGTTTISGVIDSADDADLFVFTADAKRDLVVTLLNTSTGGPLVELLSSSMTVLGSSATGFGGFFLSRLTAGSTYYIRVTGIEGATYDIALQLSAPLA